MNKTKKTAVFVLLTIFLACSLIGCTKPAEVESTEDSTVQVKIVDQYYLFGRIFYTMYDDMTIVHWIPQTIIAGVIVISLVIMMM